MSVRNLVLISAAGIALSGCATPIIGALTLNELSSFAGVASSITTGKGLGDHALSLLTGKDCSVTEGILRKDRDICEERGSLAAKEDFKGVFAWLDKQNGGSGEGVFALYERARSDELKADEGIEVAQEVVPASASGLNLRLLTFLSDGADGKPQMTTRYVYMMAPIPDEEASEAAATPPPQEQSGATVRELTFREYDSDGTPRIVTRQVKMMEPIPDKLAVADASPTAATAPARQSLAANPAAGAKQAEAKQATPSARPLSPALTASQAVVVMQPRPMIYWFLSGR